MSDKNKGSAGGITKEDGERLLSHLEKLSAVRGSYNDSISSPKRNETWQGYSARNSTVKSSWEIALNRFVDPTWYGDAPRWRGYDDEDGTDPVTDRPAIFTNETGIEAKGAKLLLQAYLSAGEFGLGVMRAEFDVTQVYVESRVRCSLNPTKKHPECSVIEQRGSQRQHRPEEISFLSFPAVFSQISQHLPRTSGSQSAATLMDPTLRYLQAASVLNLDVEGKFELEKVPKKKVGARVSQVINAYLLLGQSRNGKGHPYIGLATESETLVDIYSISKPWLSSCIICCCVLLASGILSVYLIHLTTGPEVLGYVSTAVRDSKYISIPQEAGQLDGMDLSRMMCRQRICYGFTGTVEDGKTVLGVGKEEETEAIKKKSSQSWA